MFDVVTPYRQKIPLVQIAENPALEAVGIINPRGQSTIQRVDEQGGVGRIRVETLEHRQALEDKTIVMVKALLNNRAAALSQAQLCGVKVQTFAGIAQWRVIGHGLSAGAQVMQAVHHAELIALHAPDRLVIQHDQAELMQAFTGQQPVRIGCCGQVADGKFSHEVSRIRCCALLVQQMQSAAAGKAQGRECQPQSGPTMHTAQRAGMPLTRHKQAQPHQGGGQYRGQQ